ncbi:MAG TPA: DUF1684 domain-containing protein [Vicinamibacterales bacterium]|nr:DUF1684 domain-containing protein [Vicinamibacterales bacterium]
MNVQGERIVAAACLAATMACGRATPEHATATNTTVNPYQTDVEKFRQQREAKLTSDTGWLTIAGLYFLTKPQTTVGSAGDNDVVLPTGTPSRVGTFVLAKNGKVSVTLEPGVQPTLLDGRPFSGGPIKSDGEGSPDRLVLGDVQVWVHQSGERPAIRVRDKNNPLRKEFTGMKWYPVSDAYRVEGTFEPYEKPQELQIPNMLGDIDTMTVPGRVRFTLNGKEHNMVAVTENEMEFWFIFRDLTSGDTTYPAARFLYTPRPDANGKVTLDFNRAENPPCAFNSYATCPLPPPENRLQVRVEAGEKIYARH